MEFWFFWKIDVIALTLRDYVDWAKVLYTNEVKSKIEITYQKSSFARKQKLINVFPSQRIGEVKKSLIKNVTFHLA